MGLGSSIEWTESTWNPVTGCTKISQGCKHCYAERMAKRLHGMGTPAYAKGFKLTLQEKALLNPLSWKRPQRIFVNSMSDLFHQDVPTDYIHRVFNVMNEAHWHQYQILTKRSTRLAEMSATLPWADHIWMGVSIENSDCLFRMEHLKQTKALVRFLSLEPLLGPLDQLDLRGIDWVIVGGESGPGARLMKEEWATSIRDQCASAGVSFFFKQWGGVNKKKTGRVLDGATWDEMPRKLALPVLAA